MNHGNSIYKLSWLVHSTNGRFRIKTPHCCEAATYIARRECGPAHPPWEAFQSGCKQRSRQTSLSTHRKIGGVVCCCARSWPHISKPATLCKATEMQWICYAVFICFPSFPNFYLSFSVCVIPWFCKKNHKEHFRVPTFLLKQASAAVLVRRMKHGWTWLWNPYFRNFDGRNHRNALS